MAIAAHPLASLQHSRIVYRRFAVVAMYIMAACLGAMQVVTLNSGTLGILGALGLSTSATMWFWIDSHVRSRPHPWSLQFVFFLTWPLASLIYLLASRGGVRGLGYWLLHAIGLSVTIAIASVVGMLVVMLLP
ncbi:hypothetical protein [Novipirellula maiorica]|uniref:hypothetical protein n=1 Tax=Novipirellula maiorica TaxID=1265734 RepID=UPI001181BF34|nr:hypothetical protein [Rhodopirellula maiorica]